MEVIELFMIGFVPLVEKLTEELKKVKILRPFAVIISLILGMLIVGLITRDAETMLVLGSLIGGGASVFHKKAKALRVESGEPEVTYVETKDN